MRRILYVALACLVACYSPQSKEKAISKLPSFKMLLIDSITTLKAEEIPTGKPIVLLFFRPDCPHCWEETQDILDHIDSFRNVRFYMLAIESLHKIREFCLSFNLDKYENFTIGKDQEYTFLRAFRPSSVPYMAVYDGNKKLVKIYNGGTAIDHIFKATHI